MVAEVNAIHNVIDIIYERIENKDGTKNLKGHCNITVCLNGHLKHYHLPLPSFNSQDEVRTVGKDKDEGRRTRDEGRTTWEKTVDQDEGQ